MAPPAIGFKLGQRRIDRARAGRIPPFEQRSDLPHQRIAMTRLLLDQGKQYQAQIAVPERPRAPGATGLAFGIAVRIGVCK